MITFAGVIIAVMVAFLAMMIFAVGMRRPGPWASIAAFFVLVFLAAWAGGLWLGPVGPVTGGVYWLPTVIIGLLFALLLASAVPPQKPRTAKQAIKRAEEQVAAERSIDYFFWLIFLVLAALVIVAVLRPSPAY
ncbi:MAG: hypothetical protein GF333_02545 [Candidatus Omnitrophica bacterium]|nr:hypothetical protein [Candidatus Omnitrophota bacterium]